MFILVFGVELMILCLVDPNMVGYWVHLGMFGFWGDCAIHGVGLGH